MFSRAWACPSPAVGWGREGEERGGPSPGHNDARASGGSRLNSSRQEARLLPHWSGSRDENLSFFFFNTKEKKRFVPPSPTPQPLP